MRHVRRTRRPLRHVGPRRLTYVTDPTSGRRFPVPAGGADDDEGRLQELYDRLDSESEPLTDEELAELEQLAVAAFDEADDDEDPDLDAMEELTGVITAAREASAQREQEAAERQEQAARLRETIHAVEDDEDTETAEDDDAAEASEDADTAVSDEDTEGEDAPASQAAEAHTDDQAADEEEAETTAVAASSSTPARRPSLAAASRRRRSSSQPRRRRNLSVVTAGDVPGRSAGSQLHTLREVGEAFAAKAHAVRSGRGSGKFGVASFNVDYPEDRRLGSNAIDNEERIDAVVASAQAQDIDAIVAAGGLCAPVDVAYDLEGISVENRPLRDALPRFGADRGGIRFITPPALADMDDAVGVWTEATDESPGDSTKDVMTVTCGTEQEVLVDAITKRLKVGNFSRRTFPEQFARFWQLAGAAHSRLAEETLWNAMVADSTAVTFDRQLGAARDILTVVDTAVAAYTSRHRMAENAVLRLTLPSWVKNMMRTDIAKQLPGDASMARTDAELTEWFRVRNVAVTWSPDAGQEFGAQSAGELSTFPGTVEMLLHHEGAFTFLDGGTLDFGMDIRDSTLNETNDVEAFMETFEAVAFRGVESLHITATVEPNGASAATVDTFDESPA